MIVDIKAIYCVGITALFLMGMWCLLGLHLKAGVEHISSRRGVSYQMEKLLEEIRDKSEDLMFRQIGLKLSLRRYNAIRKLLLIVIGLLAIMYVMKGDIDFSIRLILFGIGLYYLLSSKEKFGRRKTVFARFCDAFSKRRGCAMDEELTGIIMQMKNIILSKKNGTSADYILTKLIPFTNFSKAAFQTALYFVRQGRVSDAGEAFEERFPTSLGKSFARVMVKLDELPPEEFLKQLTIVQNNALEEHRTREEKKLVHIQHIKLMLAFCEAILIMGNFVYLVLIDTLDAMSFLGGI
ncbi:hypothetical protein [Anaerovorax sp. IOR16]|uniref:hypothetical protein n=1 Tax=Anaerovorax sp. IOR16 TaxID=2773458 RepID=UPI0019D1C4D8|nr:hypothetical protein [Anaerovorax sp. IOR16]